MTNLATRKMIYRVLDQYKNATKFVSLIESIGKRFDDTDAIIDHLLFARFLETAENFELDRIGEILKYRRPYKQRTDVFTYRSVSDPDDSIMGYGGVSSSVGGAYTSVLGLSSEEFIDDEQYRILLRGRAKVLTLGPSIPEFYTWITETFGIDVTLSTPETMTILIEITAGQINQYQVNFIQNYGPTLPGVTVLIKNWRI